MVRAIILVALGGGIGSIFRYFTSILVTKYFNAIFPLATFTANIVGCFIVGLMLGFFEKHQITNSELRFFLITGFCGGYTTFSTFAYENVSLFQSHNSTMAFVYLALSLLSGLFAVWLGLTLAKL